MNKTNPIIYFSVLLLLLGIKDTITYSQENKADGSINSATVGEWIAQIDECQMRNFRDCPSYKQLDDLLSSEENHFYAEQIREVVIKSQQPKITLALLDLIIRHIPHDQVVTMMHELLSTTKDNANKIQSFFLISLIILLGVTLFFAFVMLKLRTLKREMEHLHIRHQEEDSL